MNFYYSAVVPERGKVFAEVKIINLEQMPIAEPSELFCEKIIVLVNKILIITKDDDYLETSAKQDKVREYENQIDQLVYKLYDLTPEEIKLVEDHTKN